ncbi:maltase A1-like isoform X1 [Anopheles bellator]|uniref:maltase A1-like isoform X1 n=1 Tax=Anopheles bellator TaxID=139047 RepID=UPI002647608A|nr:maltase A1-like isoform X1 [Anopheles bellator]
MLRFSVLCTIWITALPSIVAEPYKGWWNSAVFYQIYPRSFMDSNGDGIGDLRGIIQRLEFLQANAIDGFWLSPIFQSPMADFGYDISDYYAIQPEYGTLEDFDALVKEANALGLQVILDFVPNHTSDEHEWFKRSEARDPSFEDFYVWHPGRKSSANDTSMPLPPSNWVSFFRGSAWQWSTVRKEYYLHQFSVKQPDLNYRNPAVVEAMKNVMRFWMARGVAGYRIDAVPTLFEVAPDADGQYPDEPLSGNTNDPEDPGYLLHIYTQDRNETLDMVYQWRAVTDEFQQQNGGRERIIMAETYSPIEIVMKYYGNKSTPGAQIPFNFHFITDLHGGSSADDFKNTINYWIDNMPSTMDSVFPNWVMGNHDQHRVASRFGSDMIDCMNMILLSLPGVSVTYNGEEIGMEDVWISYNDTVDPAACNAGPDRYQYTTRDPERTPFQWDDSKDAGFSTGNHTWLPVSPNYTVVNAMQQLSAPTSHLLVYRNMTTLKRMIKYQSHSLVTFTERDVIILRQIGAFVAWKLCYVYTIVNIGNSLALIDLTKNDPLEAAEGFYAVLSLSSKKRIFEPVPVNRIELDPKESVVLIVRASTLYQVIQI